MKIINSAIFCFAIFFFMAFCGIGCQKKTEIAPVAESQSKPTGNIAVQSGEIEKTESIIRTMVGTYVVTDCVSYRGSLVESERWAKSQIGKSIAIWPDICATIDIVVTKPKYGTKIVEGLQEGEVASGTRRFISDFSGFGTDRKNITLLEVHRDSSHDSPIIHFEIISQDLLWYRTDGWFFQLQKEGVPGKPIPLVKRQ